MQNTDKALHLWMSTAGGITAGRDRNGNNLLIIINDDADVDD